MPQTGLASFDTTIDKTNHVLRQIEREFGWSKDRRRLSYHALRAVLHALRDRLPVDEAAHLAAQLPMLIRGIYYEGWDPSRVPRKIDKKELLDRVRQELPDITDAEVARLVSTVLCALRGHITEGEWEDVKSTLPRDLTEILP